MIIEERKCEQELTYSLFDLAAIVELKEELSAERTSLSSILSCKTVCKVTDLMVQI